MPTIGQRPGPVEHPPVRVIYRLGDLRSFVADATVPIYETQAASFIVR